MSFLGILAWLLVAVAVLIAAALVMPFGLSAQVSVDGRVSWKLGLQPFGRYGPVIRLGKGRRGKPVKETGDKAPSKARSRKLRISPAAVARFLSEVVSVFRFRRLFLYLRFGCSDPADTGHVFGLLTPVLYGASCLPRTDLRIVPVFDRAALDGEAEFDVSFVPVALLPPVLRLGWSFLRPKR